MARYNWDLVERLLHNVQNGADDDVTPRVSAEDPAAQQPPADVGVAELEPLLVERGFIRPRPAEQGDAGSPYELTPRGSSLLSLLDSSIPGNDHPRQVLDDQADALDPATFDELAAKPQIA